MAEQLVDAPSQTDLGRLQPRWLGTLAPSTRRGYNTDVRSWIEHCARVGLDPRVATGRDLTAWLDGLSHLRPSTRARRLSAVMSMYTWLKDEGVVAVVPEVPRGSRPRPLGQDDAWTGRRQTRRPRPGDGAPAARRRRRSLATHGRICCPRPHDRPTHPRDALA